MSQRVRLVQVATVDMRGVDSLCQRRGSDERGERQCGDEGLHGSLLRKQCQTICRDLWKIIRWPAGIIKLPFRKLNSNLSEQVGRATGPSIGVPEDARLGTPRHLLTYGERVC